MGRHLSRWRAGFWCQILRAGGKFFLLAQEQERVSCRFYLFRFLLSCSHSVRARPIFRLMKEQPGLSVTAGQFAKVRLLQSGDVVSSLLFLCVFATMPCSRPAHMYPSLPTTSRQRNSSGSGRPLVSRPWYTRGTASLAVQLPQPGVESKICFFLVLLS